MTKRATHCGHSYAFEKTANGQRGNFTRKKWMYNFWHLNAFDKAIVLRYIFIVIVLSNLRVVMTIRVVWLRVVDLYVSVCLYGRKCYCKAPRAVYDWICAKEMLIIIIININLSVCPICHFVEGHIIILYAEKLHIV